MNWEREIADAAVIYSISFLICAATFYTDLPVSLVRAQQEMGLAQFTVATLFLGIASAIFGFRRIGDQRRERLRRIAAEHHAASLSLQDPLTLLPNRRCLEDEIGAMITRTGWNLTLLLVGLKQFQAINSVYGHASGDVVLSQIAARLRQEIETQGFLARTGDDEFAILMPGEAVDRATCIALNVSGAIKQPVQIGMTGHVVEAHVGIVQIAQQQQGGRGSAQARPHRAQSRQELASRLLFLRSRNGRAHSCALAA